MCQNDEFSAMQELHPQHFQKLEWIIGDKNTMGLVSPESVEILKMLHFLKSSI